MSKLPLIVNLNKKDFDQLTILDFLDSLIKAMTFNKYETLHIDQIKELRRQMKG